MTNYNISLTPYNTFHIAAEAKAFAAFETTEALQQILEENKTTTYSQQPLVLGGGSNLLFTKPFDGLVLKNEIKGIGVVNEDENFYYVKCGGGENWHSFVLQAIQNNWAGIENLSLIPGCAGASPIQNIGAYGVEIKDVFHELDAFHLFDHSLQPFSLKECAFGYRESVFKHQFKGQFAIVNVTYKLRKKPDFHISYGAIEAELEKMQVKDLSIAAISQAVINIRSSKLPDPAVTGNAGSFFKNPTIPVAQFNQLKAIHPTIPSFAAGEAAVKVPAGWLIEQSGWKGYRKGDAGVHPLQALVLVNYGQATGSEILELSQQIIDDVYQRFGIKLEREVNIY